MKIIGISKLGNKEYVWWNDDIGSTHIFPAVLLKIAYDVVPRFICYLINEEVLTWRDFGYLNKGGK